MKNRRKEGLTPFTRMMALLIASAMVVGLSIFAQDAYVKASEEDGEDGVVTEVADEVVEMPAPEVEPVEEIAEIVYEAPAPEPVAEPEPEPVAEEPVAEEPAPAEPIEEPAPTEPAEEPAEEEAALVAVEPEEEEENGITDEDFDVEKAYEYYLKLNDEDRENYLDSLNEEHRNVLIYYIEAHAFLEGEIDSIGEEVPEVFRAEEAEEYIPIEVEEVIPEEEEETPVKAEDKAEEAEPAEEAESAVDEEPVEEPEPEAEPEPEVVALEEETEFSTAYLSGTWAGRETSTARNVEFTVVKDGNVVASGSTLCHMSMIDLAVTPGDYEVADIQCSSYGFSGSGFKYTIDMYADTNVTLSIELTSPDYVPEEETVVEIPEEENEELPAEDEELAAEEVEEIPEEEITEEAAETEAYSVNDEWTGRETSTDRTLTVIFNIDGEEAERKEIVARYTEATFTVDTTEYELISIESENEITVEGNVCSVSFEDKYEATVIVNLATIEVEEEVEISEEEENEEDEPTYEIVSEWAGEETENTKVLTVVINVDGEEKEVKTIEGNTIKPSFMIETEGYELKEITSEAAFTLEDKLCKVDMSEEDEATVVVELIIAGEEADEAEKEPVMVDVTKHLENLSRNDGTFEIGDTVRWVAELQEDVDPDTVIYAWFSSPDHGVTINEMEGNESTYTYVLTEENCGDAWLVKAMKK